METARTAEKVLNDRLRGCLIGGALGDALGAPYEFRRLIVNRRPYSEKLLYRAVLPKRGQKSKVLVVGQTTDDTEMAITLLRATASEYNRDNVITSYMLWVNGTNEIPKAPTIGTTTGKIFKGVKTLKGVKRRLEKFTKEKGSQSNGFLMRCGPLVRFQSPDIFVQDAKITNWGPIPEACARLYGTLLILAYQGKGIEGLYSKIGEMLGETSNMFPIDVMKTLRNAWHDALKTQNKQDFNTPEAIKSGLKNSRDMTNGTHGWCVHAIYCCFNALIHAKTYKQAMEMTIKLSGDTDTNACIVGYLFGCLTGYQGLLADPVTKTNIEILVSADYSKGDLPRPLFLHPKILLS